MTYVSSQAATRARIKVILSAVAGIVGVAPVYDWIRNVSSEDSINSLFKDTGGTFHFWQFGLTDGDPIKSIRYPAGSNRATVTWDIHGYMAVKDLAATPTEKVFAGIIAAIIDAFETDKKLNGAAVESGPAQLAQAGHTTLTNVLCHYARFRFECLIELEC